MKKCSKEGKEYFPFENLEPAQLKEMDSLEGKLKYKPFINGNLITADDVLAYQNYLSLNVQIPSDKYPKIRQWIKEIERLQRNWKLSKRTKDNGKDFMEYVQLMDKKVENNSSAFDLQMKKMKELSNKINSNAPGEKEIATINFFSKLDKEYDLQIMVKFLPDTKDLTENGVSSKLSIICHNNFNKKCEIETKTGEKGEISALIKTIINKDSYDLEPITKEIKRNINGVYEIKIQSLDKIIHN